MLRYITGVCPQTICEKFVKPDHKFVEKSHGNLILALPTFPVLSKTFLSIRQISKYVLKNVTYFEICRIERNVCISSSAFQRIHHSEVVSLLESSFDSAKKKANEPSKVSVAVGEYRHGK